MREIIDELAATTRYTGRADVRYGVLDLGAWKGCGRRFLRRAEADEERRTARGTVDDEEGDMRRRGARECEEALMEATEARRGAGDNKIR